MLLANSMGTQVVWKAGGKEGVVQDMSTPVGGRAGEQSMNYIHVES